MQAGLETFSQQPCSPESCHSVTLAKVLLFVKAAPFFAKRSLQQSHFRAVNTLAFWTPRSGPPRYVDDLLVAAEDQQEGEAFLQQLMNIWKLNSLERFQRSRRVSCNFGENHLSGKGWGIYLTGEVPFCAPAFSYVVRTKKGPLLCHTCTWFVTRKAPCYLAVTWERRRTKILKGLCGVISWFQVAADIGLPLK